MYGYTAGVHSEKYVKTSLLKYFNKKQITLTKFNASRKKEKFCILKVQSAISRLGSVTCGHGGR